jgi:alkanesulfonate monooxygenase SsuD/methylene tetrahydromethanopterin reductase-like flavin-dependent oxidoreductase (luciferase family)
MKYGIDLVCFPDLKGGWKPDFFIQCATLAEKSGWNGVFIWDHIWAEWEGESPAFDPWILLAAIASHTDEIKIGPMVTPLARRRPWKLARETVTLDHLSQGRLILGVGLGGEPREFSRFGENPNNKIRGEKLDEALTILQGLWTGKPFQFHGKHYNLEPITFLPPPLQHPRIPIWVAGHYPHVKPFQRAANYDGVFATPIWGDEFGPQELHQMLQIVKQHRNSLDEFDVVVSPQFPSDRKEAKDFVSQWKAAGVSWLLEIISPWLGSKTDILERIKQGPPTV